MGSSELNTRNKRLARQLDQDEEFRINKDSPMGGSEPWRVPP